jgi:hypothetical protein
MTKRIIVSFLVSMLLFVTIGFFALKTKKVDNITPVDFQTVQSQSFNFPESEETIYEWVSKEDSYAVTKHAWGIWAGLTQKTGQVHKGRDLRVYETWHGVGQLSEASAAGYRSYGCNLNPHTTTKLKVPKQLAHAGVLQSTITEDYAILETVAYSPDAACFATSNLLFNKSVLDRLLVHGDIGKIPDFPVRSITTKPTYYVAKATNGLVKVPAWTTTPVPAKVFGHNQWKNYVYVDLENKQDPTKKLIPVTSDNPTKEEIAAATCNMSDFIGFKIDAETADYLNSLQDKGNDPKHQFHKDSVALLVAMHVTSKEIKNWTWQTYFWVADPRNPGHPSANAYADLMPDSVKDEARHYAVSPCYAMTTNKNEPMICYNPYLEAGFGPQVFKMANRTDPDFQYGVQTNCMSCHALATSSGKLGYTTDQNINLFDPMFNNDVQLDFAWSIQGNLNTDK